MNFNHQKLVKIFNVIENFDLKDAYYTNACYCFKDCECTFTESVFKRCNKYVFKEIEIINPQIIICFGKQAFNATISYLLSNNITHHF
ncbi:MAG: uracil-DNA glycosylase family protein [Candidatus Helarchaeota archaeon]